MNNNRYITSILTFFIVFQSVILPAQYIQEWAKQLGGDKRDFARTAIYDSDGRLVFAGNASKRRTGAWMVVTDSNGNEIWGKTFRDSYSSGYERIIELSDGDYLLAGFIQKRKRDRNLNGFLMKVDKKGKVKWQRRYGGEADDILSDVTEMPDGGYMAVGFSEWSEDNEEEKELWVIKTDKYGSIKKEVKFGESDEDVGNTIIRTYDNRYIIGGYALSSQGRNLRILKLDENCEIIWDFPSDYDKIREIHDIIELPDSTYAAIGTSLFKGIDYDAYMLKFDANGDTISSHTYNRGTWEEATAITQTFDGNLAVCGFEKTESGAYSDFWMRKTDYEGNELFYDAYRRKTIDYPRAIVETSDNGLVLAGSTWHLEQGWDYAVLKYKDINTTDIKYRTPDKTVTTSAKDNIEIKACITSFMKPERVDIIVNGIIQIPDAYSSLTMQEEKCLYPLTADLLLSPGMNRITVAVKDRRGNIVTEERTVYYIPPSDMSW